MGGQRRQSSGRARRRERVQGAAVEVGVEGELYTRLDPSGAKDREIEKWFSAQIETPFAGALTRLLMLDGIVRSRPMGRGPDSARRDVEDLGFIIKAYDEHLPMAADDRQALVNYLAALVVRSPVYLAKLTDWHAANNGDTQALAERSSTSRGFALENMLYLYDIYREAIGNAYITLTIADCDREFLFADGGIVAQEPWSKRPMPFDLYAPLTPKLALNVLPLSNACTGGLWVARLNAKGVARYNRIALSDAKRFVFCRSEPPLDFITRHFGVPAPAPIGSRWVNGQLETNMTAHATASSDLASLDAARTRGQYCVSGLFLQLLVGLDRGLGLTIPRCHSNGVTLAARQLLPVQRAVYW